MLGGRPEMTISVNLRLPQEAALDLISIANSTKTSDLIKCCQMGQGKAPGQRAIRGERQPLEKMLEHVFAELDRHRGASIFGPRDWRNEMAKRLGLDETSDLRAIVKATRERSGVLCYLPWVRKRLLKEARNADERAQAQVRAWVRIAEGKILGTRLP